MLTGSVFPSNGSGFINGINIEKQIQCRRFVGFCPQFDALFDLLTARYDNFVFLLVLRLKI